MVTWIPSIYHRFTSTMDPMAMKQWPPVDPAWLGSGGASVPGDHPLGAAAHRFGRGHSTGGFGGSDGGGPGGGAKKGATKRGQKRGSLEASEIFRIYQNL